MLGKTIVITSGKGGVGKSTATANIGAALAMDGKRVAVVDMDIGLRNLDVILGLENRVVFTLVDAVKGRCKISQAAIKDRKIESLYLIPAPQSENKDVLKPEEMVRFCERLRKEYDFILMDCPAGIERGFENAVAGADEAVVVCTPEVSSVRDADRVIGLLYARSINPKLIVNRIVPDMVEKGEMLSHQDVMDVLSIELLGLIPLDEQVIISTNTGVPLVSQKGSKGGDAMWRIAMRLNGQADLPIEVPTNKKGFWAKIGFKLAGKK